MVNKKSDDLIAGIAPHEIQHEVPAIKKELRGWHKPRKHWVRRFQWLKETEELILCLKLDGRPLRYLTLPGEDMLDVRVLAELCKNKGLLLKCLGFDEEARVRTSHTEVNISRNEISSNIDINSIVIADNISVLKSTTSQGFKNVKDLGPFDVINLDLCGSISCINHPDNHQVINNICEYQVNKRGEPWLLFLTTRADYEQVNIEHLPAYLKRIKENAINYKEFAKRFIAMTGFNINEYHESYSLDEMLKGNKELGFVRMFAVGFSKWLLNLVSKAPRNWKVEMLDSCFYRVEDNQIAESFPNMLSLAFRFSPIDFPLADTSGLASRNPSNELNEEILAMEILEKTRIFLDLDMILDKDEPLYKMIMEESTELLKTARYDVAQYAQWAEERKIHFYSN